MVELEERSEADVLGVLAAVGEVSAPVLCSRR
jgi:hypothetical protein